MRIYKGIDVWEAAQKRIDWLFKHFKTVAVAYSGGKDSTVCLHLVLDAAKRLGRGPTPVCFLDQEAEYESTIELTKQVMYRDDVKPHWYQVEFRLFNSNSVSSDWLVCWDKDPKVVWMRDKDPIAIKENTYGTDRFKSILSAIELKDFKDSTVFVGGVRCEESPTRLMGLTGHNTYGGETWGQILNSKRKMCVMYPLYDWSYTDIWKAIFEHGWPYNSVYDKQYSKGVSLTKMRVSSLCHEVSSACLVDLHEMEASTWSKLVNRLSGVSTTGKFAGGINPPKKVPFMFKDWKDYRDYLAEHLLSEPGKSKIIAKFKEFDSKDVSALSGYWVVCLSTILNNDHYFTKMSQFRAAGKRRD